MILSLVALFLLLTIGDIVMTLKLSKYPGVAVERNPVIRGFLSCGKFWVVVWMAGMALLAVLLLWVMAKSAPVFAGIIIVLLCVLKGEVVRDNVRIFKIV